MSFRCEKSIVLMDGIPQSLIINWDLTRVHYVPVSDWTMEKCGSNRIEIAGIDDKRQLTAVFACSMTGNFLPSNWYTRERQIAVYHPLNFPMSRLCERIF